VPEKWACREAHLETMDGRRIFTSTDNPLHVMSYSLPFSGVVEREALLRHLHVHPTLPDAVPFIFKYYERDWGLCCSRTMRDALRDEHYRVVIDSGFSYGTLKVGEVVVPGEREDSIVMCAHLCHPAMVNAALTGVVVGVDVMRALLAGRRRRYTYRLLIVPETIG
jgi:aminopeptidase-like protein